MENEGPYDLTFAATAQAHVRALGAKYRSLIREKVREQLSHEPTMQTRNRKPLRQPAPFGAAREIRFGPRNRFRVFYDVDIDERKVEILAVGEKVGNRLVVGGEEVQL
jgi:mRNA-degrading endonuclease RelE of RelBE toxin-antitoxin system